MKKSPCILIVAQKGKICIHFHVGNETFTLICKVSRSHPSVQSRKIEMNEFQSAFDNSLKFGVESIFGVATVACLENIIWSGKYAQ